MAKCKIHQRNMTATTALLVGALYVVAMYFMAQLPEVAAAAGAVIP